jgi:transcriptional regulator GlxA family with amidase domain
VSFGCTPFTYVTKCRIDRARDLLRDSLMPIAEIALVCGFAEQSNFTKVFGKLAGMPPGAWRRLHRD